MLPAKASKVELLDQFYELLEEEDWLDGIDLYQSGKVTQVKFLDSLILGKVTEGIQNKNYEVRIKIHPNGHCIQWIECTCPRNRRTGNYCQHIAAMMIHLDRENSKVFANLDNKMPIKPPAHLRKKASTAKADKAGGSKNIQTKALTAAHKILEHLQGSIVSANYMATGLALRVKVEIKPGQLTHYDLNIDAAANFVKDPNNEEIVSRWDHNIKVFEDEVAVSGTLLRQTETEKIVADRVIGIRVGNKALREKIVKTKSKHWIEKYKYIEKKHALKHREAFWCFFPLKSNAKFMGREYFFVPFIGYWKLDKSQIEPDWMELPLSKTFKNDEAAKFIERGFSPYSDKGAFWLDQNLREPIVIESPTLNLVDVKSADGAWFHLDPKYGSGESSISMSQLMYEFKNKKRKFVKSGKTWMRIPEFITQHEWQLDESGKYIKVDSLGLMRMKAAVGDLDHFAGSKTALNKIRNRTEFSGNVKLPNLEGTNLDLRSYQKTGLSWLWWLYSNHLHGLLADEMGLGKTHQAMALMSLIRSNRTEGKPKFLVIAPTTVLNHWLDKIEQFAPNLTPFIYHGPKRTMLFSNIHSSHSTLITSYGVLLRDIKQLSEIEWDVVILDEAHFVKNNSTSTYKSACKLNSSLRICLTGTPLENHLGELKSLFDFLVPGYLGSDDYFRQKFIKPIEQEHDHSIELQLQKLIHPFKLRRVKENVLPELPAKIEDIRHCDLSAEQVKLYKGIVDAKVNPLIEQLEDESNAVPYLHVFATLTLLKQICNHPALVVKSKGYEKFESGKFELLKELLGEALDSNHKVVIFSQYTEMVAIIQSYLKSVGIGHVILTGQSRNRGDLIKKFQEDDSIKVFVGSLLAGGIGIDLTAASVVIHYDRWWNASKENQATDRVHRIGQNKNVQVLKLVTKGTLEEKIDRMIASKQSLFERFLERDEELFKSLTRQDLIELLRS